MHFIGKLLLIISFVICNFRHSLQNLCPQNFNVRLLLLFKVENSSKQISQNFCLLFKFNFFSLLLFKNCVMKLKYFFLNSNLISNSLKLLVIIKSAMFFL